MIEKIKALAVDALQVQNKLVMESALKDIVFLCHESSVVNSAAEEVGMNEDYLEWAKNSISFKDWQNTDTSLAQNLTSQNLLEQCAYSTVISGWGNITEMMKRFHELTKDDSKETILSDSATLDLEAQDAIDVESIAELIPELISPVSDEQKEVKSKGEK